MAEVTEKTIVVDGVDKYAVADLKRVYGSAQYAGGEYVFLQFPVAGDTKDYRPDSYTTAVELGGETCCGQALLYHVTLTYNGHVREVLNLGPDDFGCPDTVEVEE